MTWGTDKELHKYPKGFKQILVEYYGFIKPMCVLCWSQTNINIHHHIDVVDSGGNPIDKYSYAYQYRDGRTEPDWSDLSKFVLLCGSCHSKIHSTINFSGMIDNKKAPILILLNDIIKKYKKDSKIKKNKCMPTILYNAGLPIEWYNEHVDKNGVFIPSKGIIEFLNCKARKDNEH